MNIDSIEDLTNEDLSEFYDEIIELADDIRGPYHLSDWTRGNSGPTSWNSVCIKNGITDYGCVHYNNWTYYMFYTYCPEFGSGTYPFYSCNEVCAAVGAKCQRI